jgi:hypothetical protein
MAGSPNIKLFNASGEYVGCVKTAEQAGHIFAFCNSDVFAEARWGHTKAKTLFTKTDDNEQFGQFDEITLQIVDRAEELGLGGYV